MEILEISWKYQNFDFLLKISKLKKWKFRNFLENIKTLIWCWKFQNKKMEIFKILKYFSYPGNAFKRHFYNFSLYPRRLVKIRTRLPDIGQSSRHSRNSFVFCLTTWSNKNRLLEFIIFSAAGFAVFKIGLKMSKARESKPFWIPRILWNNKIPRLESAVSCASNRWLLPSRMKLYFKIILTNILNYYL